MLKIENVVKKYNKNIALNGITYEQNDDSSVGIIGSNGAGKTTLCMAANGFTSLDEGDIILNNYSVRKNPDKIRVITNLYTEEMKLYDNLTVKECINYYKALYRCGNVNDLIEALHIDDYMNKKIRALSTGMRKKVNLLISMMNRPQILFLDEPFSGLDPKAKIEFVNLIKEIQYAYKTQLIISSHDLYELESVVENVVIMDKGKIVEAGILHNLMSKYFKEVSVKIRFRGSVDMQLLYDITTQEFGLYEAYIKSNDMGEFLSKNGGNIQIIDIESKSYSLEDLYERVSR